MNYIADLKKESDYLSFLISRYDEVPSNKDRSLLLTDEIIFVLRRMKESALQFREELMPTQSK